MSDQLSAAQPTPPPVPAPKPPSKAMDHVVPTKNQPALLGYYYAIFGLLPIIGLFLAPAAIAYGLIGLDRGNRLPRFIGYGHALFATVAGILGAIISYGLVVSLGVFLLLSYMGSKWPFPPEREPYEEPLEQLLQRVEKLEKQRGAQLPAVVDRDIQ
ncbi:MAG: hypothetical protein U0796_15805 [Gemmatales bacterium]